MKAISGRRFCRLLEQKGWRLVRTSGSHHIYMMDDRPHRVSVPVHGNTTLKVGLQRQMMKIAEIEESEL